MSRRARSTRAGPTGSKHESTAHGEPTGSKHESTAHGPGLTRARLTGSRLTVQALDRRAHRSGSRARPGPRSTRAGPGALERSRAHESPAHGLTVQAPAHRSRKEPIWSPARAERAHEGRSRSLRRPFSARYRPSALYRPSKLDGLTRARLTVSRRARSTRARLTGSRLTVQGRAHRPSPRSWTGSPSGSTFELSRDGLTRARAHRAHGPGLTAKLDGPKHESRGQSRAGAHEGTAHGLTAHRPSPRSWTGSRLTGRSRHGSRPTALERSRAHESTAHEGPAHGRPYGRGLLWRRLNGSGPRRRPFVPVRLFSSGQ